MSRQLSLIIVLAGLAFSSTALEVERVIWGYNGTIMSQRFNIVSIRLRNEAEHPFEGTLRLRSSYDSAGRRAVNRPIYVGPYSSKWVQLTPYVMNSEEYVLRWGEGPDRVAALPRPKVGGPATVLLGAANDLRQSLAVDLFPAAVFPASGALTDGLKAVVLDHEPDWSPMQKQAFVDWLYQGGTVHLLNDSSGEPPRFRTRLADLNNPATTFRVGAGTVRRHSRNRRSFDRRYAQEQQIGNVAVEPESMRIPDDIFQRLRVLVKTDHNWTLIYTLVIIYIIIIGPANFVVGRRVRDFRVALGMFFVTVALFAAVFSVIGRRGYGEKTVAHSFTYARQTQAQRFLVHQWLNLFVTSGGRYEISHQSPLNYYASGDFNDSMPSLSQNGKGGHFATEIPLYSSRSIIHRTVVGDVAMGIKDKHLAGQNGHGSKRWHVVLEREPSIEVKEAWVLHEGEIGACAIEGDRLSFPTSYRAADEWFNEWQMSQNIHHLRNRKSHDDVFTSMWCPAVVRARYAMGRNYNDRYSLIDSSPERFDLFVLASMPSQFHYNGEQYGRERGKTLFHFTVFKPTKP